MVEYFPSMHEAWVQSLTWQIKKNMNGNIVKMNHAFTGNWLTAKVPSNYKEHDGAKCLYLRNLCVV